MTTIAAVPAGLHPNLVRFVTEKWDGLSRIQEQAFQPLFEGKDAIVEAPTAGGKTEAVLFPTLSRIAAEPGQGVRILYLAPLRALLNNLQNRGERYAELCAVRAFKWHGDVGQREKLAALAQPPELLMTTPESLEATLLRKSEWRQVFQNLSAVIIDEAHNFAANDRGGHLLSLMRRAERATRTPPQRIALSATVGNPDALLHWLAGGERQTGLRIHVETVPPEREFQVHHFSSERETTETPSEERAVYRRFRSLSESLLHNQSIVFVPSRSKAERLAKAFAGQQDACRRNICVRTHHSNVSKYFRERAEQDIQCKSEDGIDAILSTSTLELGIDLGELDQVVQMDALASPSSFLQRVGRTGRRPGRPQRFRGYTLCDKDLLLLTATVNLGLQGLSENLQLPTRAFHLLAHQILCLSIQEYGVAPDVAWNMFHSVHCFSRISEDEFAELCRHMVGADYLREMDGVLVVGGRAEQEFLKAGWRRLFAVFDTAPLYDVICSKTHVGTLSVGFVEALETPFYIVLAGRLWKAQKVDAKRHIVHAMPAQSGDAPKWEMSWGLDVPRETAQEVGRILHGGAIPAFTNAEGRETIEQLQDGLSGISWQPGRVLIRSRGPRNASVLTYAGDCINRSLALTLELLGVGRASANFTEVKIKARPGHGAVAESTMKALEQLQSGEWSNPAQLSSALLQRLPRLPFSPFARCVPPRLLAMAISERSLDVVGLLGLCRDLKMESDSAP